MKIKVWLAVLIVTGFIVNLVLYFGTNNIHEINATRLLMAGSFEELEYESDLIVKAKVLPGKQTILDKTSDGTVIFGYTVTNLKIERVIKGDEEEECIVKITEEYYKKGRDIFIQGNYIPAKVNKSYIFYLKKYDDSVNLNGQYYPLDLEKGKYLFDEMFFDATEIDNKSNKELEIGTKEDGTYREWYKRVINKYMDRK